MVTTKAGIWSNTEGAAKMIAGKAITAASATIPAAAGARVVFTPDDGPQGQTAREHRNQETPDMSNSGRRFRSPKYMNSGNVDLERWYPQWSQSITSDAS
jgi:hypothetical protein